MPKQKRWELKRELEQAEGNIDTACQYIVRVGTKFKGVHDGYCDALEAVWLTLQLTRKTLTDIRDMI